MVLLLLSFNEFKEAGLEWSLLDASIYSVNVSWSRIHTIYPFRPLPSALFHENWSFQPEKREKKV
jgi:hypothetical protein